MVKPWIDPVTREKMQILGTDFLQTLLQYIDLSQIPPEMGGQYEGFVWSWPYPAETMATTSHIEEYNKVKKQGKLAGSGVAEVLAEGGEGEQKCDGGVES